MGVRPSHQRHLAGYILKATSTFTRKPLVPTVMGSGHKFSARISQLSAHYPSFPSVSNKHPKGHDRLNGYRRTTWSALCIHIDLFAMSVKRLCLGLILRSINLTSDSGQNVSGLWPKSWHCRMMISSPPCAHTAKAPRHSAIIYDYAKKADKEDTGGRRTCARASH